MSTAQTEIAELTSRGPVSYERGADEVGSQYLTFMLGGEHYAVDVHLTCISNTPDSIRGVLNLRGAIVPGRDADNGRDRDDRCQ